MPCHQKAFLPLTDPGEEKHPVPLSPRNRKRCNLMRLERKKFSLQAFRDLTTGTREDENAGSCLQDHPSRRLLGKEHRGRDPERRRPRLAHAAAGGLVRGIRDARGHVEDGKVAHYQVTLKVGFTLEDDD